MRTYQRSLVKLINKYTPNPKYGAEIGVYKGDTSNVLKREFPKCRFMFVDPWKEWEEDSIYYRMDRRVGRFTQEEWDDIYDQAVANICEFGNGNHIIFAGLSKEAIKHVDDGALDFCFIDANHHYQGVKSDIEFWQPKTRRLLCGHDYGGVFTGVKQAVNEIFGEENIIVTSGKIWAVIL